jgi:hypothetical protein
MLRPISFAAGNRWGIVLFPPWDILESPKIFFEGNVKGFALYCPAGNFDALSHKRKLMNQAEENLHACARRASIMAQRSEPLEPAVSTLVQTRSAAL